MSYVITLVMLVLYYCLGHGLVNGYYYLAWLFEGSTKSAARRRPWSIGATAGNICFVMTAGFLSEAARLCGVYDASFRDAWDGGIIAVAAGFGIAVALLIAILYFINRMIRLLQYRDYAKHGKLSSYCAPTKRYNDLVMAIVLTMCSINILTAIAVCVERRSVPWPYIVAFVAITAMWIGYAVVSRHAPRFDYDTTVDLVHPDDWCERAIDAPYDYERNQKLQFIAEHALMRLIYRTVIDKHDLNLIIRAQTDLD